MNLLELALKMEMEGNAYYKKLASETIVPGLKTIFTNLAMDEQKHYETISKMWEGVTLAMADSNILEGAKNVFQELLKDQQIADSMKKSLDGYQHAMKIEADSVKLYEEMAGKENDPERRNLILQIRDEEQKHYNIMGNLYDFTLEPEYFLAWREFSNLKEL